MVEKTLKSEVQDMNENQTICWHYVMDLHYPHEIWYSVHIMENDLYEPDGDEINGG